MQTSYSLKHKILQKENLAMNLKYINKNQKKK